MKNKLDLKKRKLFNFINNLNQNMSFNFVLNLKLQTDFNQFITKRLILIFKNNSKLFLRV